MVFYDNIHSKIIPTNASMERKNLKAYIEKDQRKFSHDSDQSHLRFSGFVKFFNNQKGYGFIIPTEDISQYYPSRDIPPEIFVHHSAIVTEGIGFRCLSEYESVEFELVQGPKGIQAGNVTGPRGAHVLGDPVYSGSIITHIPPILQAPNGYFQPSPYTNPDGVLLNGMLQSSNYHHSFAPFILQTPPGFYPPGVISISPTVITAPQQYGELLSPTSTIAREDESSVNLINTPQIQSVNQSAKDSESISV